MILTGLYDSPFVRRVAITLHAYGIAFERRPLSVFTDFDAMMGLTPLGKVPVLQIADDEALFDSSAILDYLDGLAGAASLTPGTEPARREVLRIDAIALGVAEKVYERGIDLGRKAAADPDWIERLTRQICSGLDWLERRTGAGFLHGGALSRADVTATAATTFLREKQPDVYSRDAWPRLTAHGDRCEALTPFAAAPYSVAEAQGSGWKPLSAP